MQHDEIPDNDEQSLPFSRAIVSFGKGHLYPYIELEMKIGGVVKGFVVPAYLEDKLPSPFDGMELPPNPLFSNIDSDFQAIVADEARRDAETGEETDASD